MEEERWFQVFCVLCQLSLPAALPGQGGDRAAAEPPGALKAEGGEEEAGCAHESLGDARGETGSPAGQEGGQGEEKAGEDGVGRGVHGLHQHRQSLWGQQPAGHLHLEQGEPFSVPMCCRRLLEVDQASAAALEQDRGAGSVGGGHICLR